MTNNSPGDMIPSKGNFFSELILRVRLVLRLMGDARVSILLKVIPVAAVVYWVLPDIAIGPIDDAAVLWLGSYLFVELCPPEVVDEHMRILRSTKPAGWMNPTQNEVIIDAEFKDVGEEDKNETDVVKP